MTIVLLHSPLVGPLTWRGVAALLPGDVLTPDLTGATTHQAVADRVAEALTGDEPAVLVGHSGAGPLLPRIAHTVEQPVAAVVYADSVLPHPGQSWVQKAPADLVELLVDLVDDDGVLPPWHEWFGPGAIAEILPDPELRAAFVAELPRLPFSYFTEPAAGDEWSGPAAYLLLSEGYREDAEAARRAGLPVVEHVDHHLAMLTDPAGVAAAVAEVIP